MPKYIRTADHAKSIRADIKAAKKAGKINPAIKISVTTDTFAGGSAIRVYVREVPATFPVYDRAGLAWREANLHTSHWNTPEEYRERFSPEARALLATLNTIVGRYHEDNSTGHEGAGDICWNVNFYKTVDFDWECENLDKVRARSAAATAQIDPEIVALARKAAANDAEPTLETAPAKSTKPRFVAYLVEIKH